MIWSKTKTKENGKAKAESEPVVDERQTKMVQEIRSFRRRHDEELMVLRRYKDTMEARLQEVEIICNGHDTCEVSQKIKNLILKEI